MAVAASSSAILVTIAVLADLSGPLSVVPGAHKPHNKPLTRTNVIDASGEKERAAKQAAVAAGRKKAFEQEARMTFSQRMKRWDPLIAEASKRFGIPQLWLRAVMQLESGGRTMLTPTQRITSTAGAMGLMQLMPETYAEMRDAYALGPDPYDPHDNIIASAAYLRWLHGKYGYPTMFAAYNDGPGNLEQRLLSGGLLPAETRNYVTDITEALEGRGKNFGRGMAEFTRPDGSPVLIGVATIRAVRAALPDEYAPSVKSVITSGKLKQGVREDVAQAKAIIRAHGGLI